MLEKKKIVPSGTRISASIFFFYSMLLSSVFYIFVEKTSETTFSCRNHRFIKYYPSVFINCINSKDLKHFYGFNHNMVIRKIFSHNIFYDISEKINISRITKKISYDKYEYFSDNHAVIDAPVTVHYFFLFFSLKSLKITSWIEARCVRSNIETKRMR